MIIDKILKARTKRDSNNPLTGLVTMLRALQITAADGRRAITLSRHDWKQAEEELSTETARNTEHPPTQ